MRLVSVNVGRAEAIGAKGGLTGINKRPVDGDQSVGALGLDGDAICDTASHGGLDQAVYLYGSSDYAWWSAELGREIGPGSFGENLTIDGFASADIAIGDRLRIGDVDLEVTSPRIPCLTLATRMGDKHFVKAFMQAGRPGAYCRVLAEGTVHAGAHVGFAAFAGSRVPLVKLFRRIRDKAYDDEAIGRLMAAPIPDKLRAELEGRIALP